MERKNKLLYYPSFFLSSLVLKSVSWLVFAVLFLFLGKKYLGADILGNIYNWIFNKKNNFNEYFLGGSEIAEKNKIFNYATFFLVAIVVLNIFSLWLNLYLWKKKRYIENNNFYLYNKWIFISNSLIHVACACLLILSFVSPFTVILALLFITFNSFEIFSFPKRIKNPKVETFFSWKNQYVRRIVFYSAIVIFVVPLVIGRFQRFNDNALKGSPEGFGKVYQELINSSDTVKKIMELITKANYSLFHWFILIWFFKGLIDERQKKFTYFWTKVNGIKKRLSNFKFHYYYQQSWANANNSLIYLGDYNYLKNNPNFLIKDYLESDLDIENFAKKNREVINYIELCEDKINNPSEKNFLNYCLFNEFVSWNDFLRTRKFIEMARKQ